MRRGRDTNIIGSLSLRPCGMTPVGYRSATLHLIEHASNAGALSFDGASCIALLPCQAIAYAAAPQQHGWGHSGVGPLPDVCMVYGPAPSCRDCPRQTLRKGAYAGASAMASTIQLQAGKYIRLMPWSLHLATLCLQSVCNAQITLLNPSMPEALRFLAREEVRCSALQ